MPNPTQLAHLSPQEKRVLLNKLLQEREQTTYSYPLSYGQQALWFIYQTAPDNPAYNMGLLLELQGELQPVALHAALQKLVNRHPALRTTLTITSEQSIQTVQPTGEAQFVIHEANPATLNQDIKTAYEQPFNLTQGPVLRATLFRLSTQRHLLLLTMHHIFGDASSMAVLNDELFTLYQAEINGQVAALPPLAASQAEFVHWENSHLSEANLAELADYWQNQLAGEIPLLNLPTDHARPTTPRYQGASQRFSLSATLTQQMQQLAQQEQVTLFTVLLTAFQLLLHRYTDQPKIWVGTPTSISRQQPKFAQWVGYLVNPVILQTTFDSPSSSFRALLSQSNATVMAAIDHASYPFPLLVKLLRPQRDLSQVPLLQTMFDFQPNSWSSRQVAGLTLLPIELDQMEGQFDLTLSMSIGQTLAGAFRYNTDLFDSATIERLAGHFQILLAAIVANPDQPIATLPLLTETERQQILIHWNDTTTDYPQDKSIHQLFEEQVARTPDNIAVIFEQEQLTYQELNQRANQLAHHLQALGVRPEVLVGICMERSIDMVVGLLGILKAGGAYVPLDPTYPAERLAFMLQDAYVPVLLSQNHLKEQLPPTTANMVWLDTDWAQIATYSAENPEHMAIHGANLAYVIYTSGSTGQPKGAMNTHAGIYNRLLWMQSAYPLTATDRILQKTPFSFDVSVWEFFWPLMFGAQLVVARPGGHQEPSYLVDLITQKQITTLHFVPSMLQAFLDTPNIADCKSLKRVICSGEALPLNVMKRFLTQLNAELHNLYGPTEAAVDVSYWPCQPDTSLQTVPIGRPVANTQLYILDRYLQPVPIGVSGELYIGGVQLARGYLNRPELTAEKFIANPFGEGWLYKTGDLARYLPDGNIEYLGRIDHQVKIRGFRIELGEIEALLHQHDAVQEAIVVAQTTEHEQKRLVAYLQISEKASLREKDTPLSPNGDIRPFAHSLRDYLKSKLPDYMVPSFFVVLDKFPLTPNGKIDRKALPAPEHTALATVAEFAPPQTPTEQLLATIWSEVLGVAQVGRHDNFFELGGHSLLATQVISRLRAVFGLEIAIRSLFEQPTVATLSQLLDNSRQSEVPLPPPMRVIERSAHLPLSFAQQRLWFIDQFEGPSPTYNIPLALRLTGDLDLTKLETAFNQIIQRHEILRTTFPTLDGMAYQQITPALTVTLAVIAVSPQECQRLLTEDARRPFDLAHGPLFRLMVYRLSLTEYVMLLNMHHIISDGWSISILMRELLQLYQGRELPKLAYQYADFAVWQRGWLQGEVLARQLSYWQQQLAHAPTLLDLPTDHPRPAVQSFNGSLVTFALNADVTTALQQVTRQQEVTLFMTLYATFAVLLSRYSGQDDLVIGSPIANRHYQEIEPLIGFFVNTLALRTDLSGQPTFSELLKRVRQLTLTAYNHQDVPFEQLVGELNVPRNLSHTPLFQVMFSFDNTMATSETAADLQLQPIEFQSHIAKFDLTLSLMTQGQELWGGLEYNTDLFERDTIERMVGHFQTLLAAIVANPDQPIATLPLLTETERQQILIHWNDTTTDYPQDKSIHQLFEEQVKRTPDNIAVIFEQEQLTYHELNQRANQLAHYLQALGVGPEVLVGICVERSIDMVVGLLAILKAGGAYVPLDPTYPAERLAFMLQDAYVPVLLSQNHLKEQLPPTTANMVWLDMDWSHIATYSAENPVTPQLHGANLAYVIYTSGSTGQPKGVMIEHAGLAHHIRTVASAYQLTAQDKILQFASMSFDTAMEQIFEALLTGAALILRGHHVWSMEEFNQNLLKYNLTVVELPPIYLHEWINRLTAFSSHKLRLMMVSGEKVTPSTVRLWQERMSNNVQFLNSYGPTEATIGTTLFDLTHYPVNETIQHIPIGRPLAGRKVYILDSHLQPVPIGVPGELHIGGVGVARGYLNRPELTAEKFIANPFGEGRLYKTGDLVRYLPDGNIEFLGRIDHQVKIRGFRIELGEIEAVLRQHDAVQEAIVVVQTTEHEQKRLVAYLQISEKASLRETESPIRPFAHSLREHLKSKLPDYMIPSFFVLLDKFPLTPNGKIDRKALPAPEQVTPTDEFAPPRTPVEAILVELWQQLLHLEQVSIHANFFNLGGDSILSLQLISRAKQRGIELSPPQIFQYQTIAELAAVVLYHPDQANSPAPGWQPDKVAGLTGEVPLTAIQQGWANLNLPNPNIYNQSLLIEIDSQVDLATLTETLRVVQQYHDSFQLRYQHHETGWQQRYGEPTDNVYLQVIEATGLTEAVYRQKVAEISRQLELTLHLEHGPLMALALFQRTDGPSYLLWMAHHLVVDWVSWRILLGDVEQVYHQLQRQDRVQLPAKTTSFQKWVEWLHQTAAPQVMAELPYWVSRFQDAPNLPLDYPQGEPVWASMQAAVAELSVAETQSLLQQVPVVYDTQINDILLTALVQTIAEWSEQTTVLIELESHGREPMLNGIADATIDLSRSVGWFTTAFPVRLEYQAGSLGDLIRSIKAQLRQIPNKGLGYGILRYLQPQPDLVQYPLPPICFNYLGQFEEPLATGQTKLLRGTGMPDMAELFADTEFLRQNGATKWWNNLFDLELMVVAGQLKVIWLYSRNLHQPQTVERLLERFMTHLRQMINTLSSTHSVQ